MPRDGLSDDDESSNDDEADASEDADPKFAINYHCLPLNVFTDFVAGFDVKHVIDLTPTPLNLSSKFASKGVSYVALCATSDMKDFLKNNAFTEIRKAICNENEPILYDPRFKGTPTPNCKPELNIIECIKTQIKLL